MIVSGVGGLWCLLLGNKLVRGRRRMGDILRIVRESVGVW